ncbi:MAG: RNA polymerase sigma factor region1.1 domain-containing protein, partial [Phycisphaerales bacterium]|nr:RNA polymerase sigma factor region1.1 domain-containing protein [Phycisphaerales bacterium]
MSDTMVEVKNPIQTAVDELMELGRKRGFVTWEEMNTILPDEAVDPNQLELILLRLEEASIETLDEADAGRYEARRKAAPAPKRETSGARAAREVQPAPVVADGDGDGADVDIDVAELVRDVGAKRIDDPVRMYLTQMGEIPLLTRAEEIRLAKKIELTRMAFRQKVLESDYCAGLAVEILQQVHDGTLPFDRTMKISTSEHAA